MKALLFILISFGITSCMILNSFKLTDNAFYNINDASIRLVFKHKSDSLHKTNYEQTYNLPGKYYKQLSTTNTIDTSNSLGILIKFWAKIIMNEKGTYYGNYPKNGLLDKVSEISISFKNEDSTFDITPYLYGDSTIFEVKWSKCEYKKLPYSYGKCPYFSDIESMIKSLNNGSELKQIDRHDYILWIDREVLNKISFKPTMLQMIITLIDKTGKKPRQLVDSMQIE